MEPLTKPPSKINPYAPLLESTKQSMSAALPYSQTPVVSQHSMEYTEAASFYGTRPLIVMMDTQSEFIIEKVSVLKEGSHFGEFALLHQKPRSATIICITDTLLAVIDKATYERDFKEHLKIHLNTKIKYLKSLPLFQEWTRTTLARFTYFMEKASYKRTQVVCREGEPCTHVYLVLNGEFESKNNVQRMKRELGKRHSSTGMRDPEGKDIISMTEFLPHVTGKQYASNVKNGRFLKALADFKQRKVNAFEHNQTLSTLIFGYG